MTTYNTETLSTQFINKAFIDKLDNGFEKEASVAMSTFVRQKLREDGFARQILPPILVTAAELDRQLTEEPTIIVEKEMDSVAANLPFLSKPKPRYFKGDRYAVTFGKIESDEFTKSKFELATYRTDIRTVLQENSVKDIQKQEDQNFYNQTMAVAQANSSVYNIGGGFSINNLKTAVQYLTKKQLPVGTILMTQSMYADYITQPSTQMGADLVSQLVAGEKNLNKFYGWDILVTNKNDILPDNQVGIFTSQPYLGQSYLLQDAVVFIKTEADLVTFKTYESYGLGIGNINGIIYANF